MSALHAAHELCSCHCRTAHGCALQARCILLHNGGWQAALAALNDSGAPSWAALTLRTGADEPLHCASCTLTLKHHNLRCPILLLQLWRCLS